MNKEDFPLLKKNIVYLDNSATTQKPQIVIDAIKNYYTNTNANVHRGIYNLSEEATRQYEEARNVIAKFINADSKEVIFTSGTTESLNMVADLLDFKNIFKEGDTILSTVFEHHSNFLPWQRLAQKHHSKIELVNITKDYEIDIDDIVTKVSRLKPKILAVSHISNILGTIVPVKKIISSIRKFSPNTIVIVDSAQSIAHLNIDVKSLDCDFLAFSGHKVYGPTGIGVLYGKESILKTLSPVKLGGGIIDKVTKDESTFIDIPHRFEAGTPNIEGAIGLKSAIEYINNIGFDKIIKYEKELGDYAYRKLTGIKGIQLYCTSNDNHIGVFSFNIEDIHPHDLSQILDESNICVRAGHNCAQILHRDILKVSASIRASFSFYNDDSEVDLLVKKIEEAKNRFKL